MPPPRPTPVRVWPRYVGALAVLVVGAAAALGLQRDLRHDAERNEAVLADQTGNVVAATVQQLLAALGGSSGVVDGTGRVDEAAFEAYAAGVIDASPFQAVAFVQVVPADERAAFERSIGRPIADEPGGGPAPDREVYLPVRQVVSISDVSGRLIGYDIATDDVRRTAALSARDSGATVVTRTVPSQPSGTPAVFVIHPLYRAGTPADATVAERREAIVGYATSGLVGDALLGAVTDQVGDPVGIRIEDGPAGDAGGGGGQDAAAAAGGRPRVLAESSPPPGDGTEVERRVGGRAWRITVDDRQAVSNLGPGVVAAGAAATAVTLAVLAWRAGRHRRERERDVAMIRRIAGLGRSLAATASVADLARVVEAEVPAVLAADRARLMPSGTDPPDEPPPDGETGTVIRRGLGGDDGGHESTLEVTWPPGETPDDVTLAGLATVAEMCGQTLGRARLSDRARRDAVTSRLLAGLAEAAATAGTTEQVAQSLVRRAAEGPAATATHIGIVTDDETALVVLHRGPDAPSAEVEVLPLDRRLPITEAYRRRAPVLLPDETAMEEQFPGIRSEARTRGLRALAALPLVGDDGDTFGVLRFAWDRPQRFDAEVVEVLRTTADLCASSLDRARATDRSQAQAAALTTLAGQLSASRSFDDVRAAIAEHATPVLGAATALVGVVEPDGLRLLRPHTLEADRRADDPVVDLDSDFPALIAMRRRSLITFTALEALPDRAVADDLARRGLHAGACAPLISSDGEVAGVFVALWVEAPHFDEALRARITTVAELCAQSAERSRLFDAEHRVRSDLQRSMVAVLPAVDGLDVAARYRPAADTLGMGGDWYDAVTLEGGRLCLVVGDVSGHGVSAIAEMTQVRTVVHTLAAGGTPLSEILLRTSAVMQRDGLGYATVLIAVVDPAAGTLDYVTAGHPPPLVKRPGGTVDTLTGGRHSVLGIELTPRPPGFLSFPTGSTLVIYTDGLIEERGTAIDESVTDLASRLRTMAAPTADLLADALLEEPDDGPARDDVALVVARHVG